MRFKLDNSDIGKCLTFSYQVTKRTKNYYSMRNTYASTEKMVLDHAIGKMAEIAVYSYLEDNDKECTYPSFKIDSRGDSGDIKAIIDGDLKIIHVKCVRHDSPVQDSWLIEAKDLLYFGDNDYFALCKFYDPDEIEICKIIKANKIKWKEPFHKSLVSKKACYLNDLTI